VVDVPAAGLTIAPLELGRPPPAGSAYTGNFGTNLDRVKAWRFGGPSTRGLGMEDDSAQAIGNVILVVRLRCSTGK
jgi:hypothetical protein